MLFIVEGSSPEEVGLAPCPLFCLGIAILDRSSPPPNGHLVLLRPDTCVLLGQPTSSSAARWTALVRDKITLPVGAVSIESGIG